MVAVDMESARYLICASVTGTGKAMIAAAVSLNFFLLLPLYCP